MDHHLAVRHHDPPIRCLEYDATHRGNLAVSEHRDGRAGAADGVKYRHAGTPITAGALQMNQDVGAVGVQGVQVLDEDHRHLELNAVILFRVEPGVQVYLPRIDVYAVVVDVRDRLLDVSPFLRHWSSPLGRTR